ncbi:MAG: hypothetical protein C4538_11880 [Nitrospiraceae bacterium]|nr:MAG: hypothetical protein C4538_11880 [Nitrospiraceae bacterium]
MLHDIGINAFHSKPGGNTVRKIVILALAMLLPAGAFADANKGKMLYDAWCAQCHGYEGDGKGYASGNYTLPQPRDFTKGTYKFRTTPSGEPPTDEDIVRSTQKGNPGTSMPPWTRFSDEEVRSIVEYIKSFDEETFELQGKAFQIGKAPSPSDALIKQGMEIFEKAKCWECHGRAGRGNGEKGWQSDFKNDGGTRAWPTDLTHNWEYRNFPAVEDIYRSITSGFDGTPMASFQTSYSEQDRWALSHYVKSLQVTRKTGSALTAKKVDTIPAVSDKKQWEAVAYIDLPLSGQLIFEPRQFIPVVTNIRVRSLYTDAEVSILLEWTDKRPNKGSDGHPADAVRLQFPVQLSSGAEKPYFYLGDSAHPVNLWYWRASDDQAVEFNASGQKENAMVTQEQNNIRVESEYSDGLYRILLRRPLATGDKNDITFVPDTFIPLSVTVYDGEHDEQADRAAISAWYHVMLEPPAPLKVYVLPPAAAFACIGASLFIRKKLKKLKT